jgi:hypothetical protein
MGICRLLLSRKEEVSLFDNGLRIESNLKILCNEKVGLGQHLQKI